MTVAEREQGKRQLREAARELRERGHMRGNFVGADGEVCAANALALGAGIIHEPRHGSPCDSMTFAELPAVRLLYEKGVLASPEMGSVCSWNNFAHQTGERVADTFEEVARKA